MTPLGIVRNAIPAQATLYIKQQALHVTFYIIIIVGYSVKGKMLFISNIMIIIIIIIINEGAQLALEVFSLALTNNNNYEIKTIIDIYMKRHYIGYTLKVTRS